MSRKFYAFALLFGALTVQNMAAEVKWLEETHDFGAFHEDGGDVSCTFKMVNVGPEPVAIVAARATCGCTTPKYQRGSIMPGDTVDLSVSYNPIGRPGRFDKKIYVDLSDKSIPRQTLYIKGTVIGSATTMAARYPVDGGDLKLDTKSVAFGDVPKGRTKNAFLKVYNSSDRELTPGWADMPKYLRVTTNSPTIKPGEQTTYVLSADGANFPQYGFVNEVVKLVPGNGQPEIPIEVMAMVIDDFSKMTVNEKLKAPVVRLSQDAIDFGAYDTGQKAMEATFRITNEGENTLQIRRVYSADPGVEVKVGKTSLKHGQSAEVKVKVAPSNINSDILNARVVVVTNDPTDPVATVRLVGYPKATTTGGAN